VSQLDRFVNIKAGKIELSPYSELPVRVPHALPDPGFDINLPAPAETIAFAVDHQRIAVVTDFFERERECAACVRAHQVNPAPVPVPDIVQSRAPAHGRLCIGHALDEVDPTVLEIAAAARTAADAAPPITFFNLPEPLYRFVRKCRTI